MAKVIFRMLGNSSAISMARWMGYFLLLISGVIGFTQFSSIYNNGQGSPIPKDLDPLVSILVALGTVIMMAGMLWLTWVITMLPMEMEDTIARKYPKLKFVSYLIGIAATAGLVYWLYSFGVIGHQTGIVIFYALGALAVLYLLMRFSPLGTKIESTSWGTKFAQKLKQRSHNKRIKRLEKQVLSAQQGLAEAEEELKLERGEKNSPNSPSG